MSDTVHYTGTLTPIIATIGLDFVDAIDKLKSMGYELEDVDYDEQWIYDPKIIYFKKQFFLVDKTKLDAYDDVFRCEKIDNYYKFEVRFYNGGCGFEEALDKAFKTLYTKESNMVNPISPDEVIAKIQANIPNEIIQIINDLIVEDWNGRTAIVKQNKIIERYCEQTGIERNQFDFRWLDVEDKFREVGWKVVYESPSIGDSWDAFFSFAK